jgi:hypothetical protein
MKKPKRVRLDPVILQMRLSQVRELVSRLSSIHSGGDSGTHIGWANCECDLAIILRELTSAIQKHLGLEPFFPTVQTDSQTSPSSKPR